MSDEANIQRLEQKIDTVDVSLLEMKLTLVKIETLMSERAKQDIPSRVSQLEATQSKILGYGAAAILFVPLILKQIVEYVKGIVT